MVALAVGFSFEGAEGVELGVVAPELTEDGPGHGDGGEDEEGDPVLGDEVDDGFEGGAEDLAQLADEDEADDGARQVEGDEGAEADTGGG